MDLQNLFADTLAKYNSDKSQIGEYWSEIKKSYTQKKRYYHNLSHLETLLTLLQQYKSIVSDWDTLVFSVFYHDIVYNVLKKDNEEKSAELANKRLTAVGAPALMIEKCYHQIVATKEHTISEDADTNLFTDADLSILGAQPAVYVEYCKQIRKEYAYFPDILYKPGRRKVLEHFLGMPRIYKTEPFFSQFEQPARQNLQSEIANLD